MQEPTSSDLFTDMLIGLFVLTFVSAIVFSFFRYYSEKDFDYLVEAACDPATEECFVRDCSALDECPPNQLALYKTYHVTAREFAECGDNSCATTCALGGISCRPVRCSEALGDTCRGPEIPE